MFQNFMKMLLQELAVEAQKGDKTETQSVEIPEIQLPYILEVEENEISIADYSPSLFFSSTIPLSLYNGTQEAVFTELLQGNFMGQATKNATLGLDETGENIIISYLTFEITSYRLFREAVEDFINVVCFWKSRVAGNH